MKGAKIGALWKKKAKDSGKIFYSGEIDIIFMKIPITVFVNDKKEKDSHPDLNIIYSPRDEEKRNTNLGNDPFGDDGRASPNDDPFGDKPVVQGKGMDIESGEEVIEL